MSENVSVFLNRLQEVSIVNGRLVRGADSSGSILASWLIEDYLYNHNQPKYKFIREHGGFDNPY